MKLILSSCDFRNDKARNTIIENLNKPIEECKLLFIPNEKATVEVIHSEKYYFRMQEFGFKRENIFVFDFWNSKYFLKLDLDIIYISGGNTFETIKRIKDCNFDKEIIRYVSSGVTYIGGSAGAHIVSKSIEHVANFDAVPDEFNDFNGLGLFDGILICHYTPERKSIYDKLNQDGKYKVYALTDEESLVITDKEG
jgi:peptidase E